MLYTYQVKDLRVLDGDTFEFTAQLGFGVTFEMMVRLKDFNTAETNTYEGRKAKQYAQWILESCNDIVVKTYKTSEFNDLNKEGKYGRWIADVFDHPNEHGPLAAFYRYVRLQDDSWCNDGRQEGLSTDRSGLHWTLLARL